VSKWITQLYIINSDGTDVHALFDGTTPGAFHDSGVELSSIGNLAALFRHSCEVPPKPAVSARP
jgi:hypothetical protein